MRIGRSLIVACGVGIVVGALSTVGARAQPADPLTALLTEVHALRLAMEQQATLGPRIQVAMARLNIQEQRLNHINTQLDLLHTMTGGLNPDGGSGLRARLDELDKQLQIETDPSKRAAYEREQKQLKAAVENQGRMLQQYHDRENDLLQSAATEQSRWNELNAQLDELERQLGPPPR